MFGVASTSSRSFINAINYPAADYQYCLARLYISTLGMHATIPNFTIRPFGTAMPQVGELFYHILGAFLCLVLYGTNSLILCNFFITTRESTQEYIKSPSLCPCTTS